MKKTRHYKLVLFCFSHKPSVLMSFTYVFLVLFLRLFLVNASLYLFITKAATRGILFKWRKCPSNSKMGGLTHGSCVETEGEWERGDGQEDSERRGKIRTEVDSLLYSLKLLSR